MANQFATREEWLNFVMEELRPRFKAVGAELPKKIRLSVGFTSYGYRGKAIGECWDSVASADKTFEILIKPDQDDASRVADILCHELCHAAVGLKHGHKRPFRRVALAMGLEGKMTATRAGAEFLTYIGPILRKAGPLPHKMLNSSRLTKKKQTTRLLKCWCEECGYTCRVTAKWIEASGTPFCGEHPRNRMVCDEFDGDDEGED